MNLKTESYASCFWLRLGVIPVGIKRPDVYAKPNRVLPGVLATRFTGDSHTAGVISGPFTMQMHEMKLKVNKVPMTFMTWNDMRHLFLLFYVLLSLLSAELQDSNESALLWHGHLFCFFAGKIKQNLFSCYYTLELWSWQGTFTEALPLWY